MSTQAEILAAGPRSPDDFRDGQKVETARRRIGAVCLTGADGDVRTEKEIEDADPRSQDASRVQAALARLSAAVQQIVIARELSRRASKEWPEESPPEDEKGAGRPTDCTQKASTQASAPEDPPPRQKVGAAPRPEDAAPCSFSITTSAGHDTDRGGFCYG